MDQRPEHTSPKKIHRWQISTGDAPHLAIRETQIKATRQPCTRQDGHDPEHRHHTPAGTWSHGNPPSLWGEQTVQPLWRTVWRFLTELNTLLGSSNHAPWYLPRGAGSLSTRNLHTDVYSSLCTIARSWKPPGCPPVGDG